MPNFRLQCLFVRAVEKSTIYGQTALRIFVKMTLYKTPEEMQLNEYSMGMRKLI